MAASLSTVASSNLMDFSSVFNLIGAIADISACHREKSVISKTFNKAIAQPTCIVPPWSTAATRAGMKGAENEEVKDSYQEAENDFSGAIDKISTWLDQVDRVEANVCPSSLLIGKVWTRLYFNLNNIADEHKKRLSSDSGSGRMASQSNAAKIMRFNVLAFLHAVLVEESLYHSISSKEYLGEGLRLNPVTSVDEFEKKLREMKNELATAEKTWEETHPLFFLLISCPLLHPFIFPVGGVNSSPRSYAKEENFRKLISSIIYSDAPNYDFISKDEFNSLFQNDTPNNIEANIASKTITSLNTAKIADANYPASKPV